MKTLKLVYLITALVLFSISIGWSNTIYNRPLDSLLSKINQVKVDSEKVDFFYKIANEYYNGNISDSAELFGNKALSTSQYINYKNGLSKSFSILGLIKRQTGDFPASINFYLMGLKVDELTGDTNNIIRDLLNIGETQGFAGNYSSSMDYINKGLKLAREHNNAGQIASALSKMGVLYFRKKELTKALDLFLQALQTQALLDDKKAISGIYLNIGAVYGNLNQHKMALTYHFKAYELFKELNLKSNMGISLANIGSNFIELKKYSVAEKYLHEALNIFKTGNMLSYERYGNIKLSELFQAKGDYKTAFTYYTRAILLKDSLFTIEKNNEITRKELKYEFDKKEELLKSENEKQKLVSAERENQQKVIIWSVVGGLLLVLSFSLLIFRSLKITQRQKKIIEEQRNQVAEQKTIVENQKLLVEEKQKEILDSISYAKRIQNSLMASELLLNEHLKEYFIFYKPKDIVSGDFYWAEQTKDKFMIALCDSTGHGVPGAFMSLLNITKLNEAVREKNILTPGKTFDYVRNDIIHVLNPKGAMHQGREGMDAVLCSFDFKNYQLEYACANNSFYIIRENKLIESSVDKMPVGMHSDEMPDFTTHTIDLQKGDVVYLFTDGYADQFGGPKGKKFKYSQLKELLIEISPLSMIQQKEMIETRIENWKGKIEQVDDILVMGIRV